MITCQLEFFNKNFEFNDGDKVILKLFIVHNIFKKKGL